MESAQFGVAEYSVVVLMLLLSLAVGLYFSLWSRQDSYAEYMLGGRRMTVFPVAMSQVASHISGLAMVGAPAEIYSYGTQYCVAMISDMFVPIINITIFIPVFYNLQINSLYEYLDLRFSHGTRVLGSLIFVISQAIYLPAIIYVPALVFNQGVSVQVVATAICAVCIIYTTLGGLKAVLWTDALQNVFSLLAVVFVITLGVQQLGGTNKIYNIAKDEGRVELFNMDVSPFVRSSFWSMMLGNFGVWLTDLAINPGAFQRSLSLPTLSQAKRALLWTSFGVVGVHALVSFLGLILYARYHGCDPIATGEIKKTAQLLPLYVMEVTRNYPGLAGLFVSGVTSAALSSMSAALNTMAGTLYEDIVQFFCKGEKRSDRAQSFIMKTISLVLGILCVCLVLLVDKADSLFQIQASLSGVTNGSLLSLFIMGLFIPRVNSKGAMAGSLTSLAVMAWISGHTQYFFMNGQLQYPGKHTSVHLCPTNYSGDTTVMSRLETYRGYSSPLLADPSVSRLYQISYMYYTLLGTLVGLTVGVAVSLLTAKPDPSTLDPKLFYHGVHRFLPKPNTKMEMKEEFNLVKFTSIPEEDRRV